MLGYQIKFEEKVYYVFDLNVKQIFNEKPKKGEEPVDDQGNVKEVDTRHGYYPEDIANTFGVPMEQHKKETEVTEMDGFVNIAMLTGVAGEQAGTEGIQDGSEKQQDGTERQQDGTNDAAADDKSGRSPEQLKVFAIDHMRTSDDTDEADQATSPWTEGKQSVVDEEYTA